MRTIERGRQFRKDYKRATRQGCDVDALKRVVKKLVGNDSLPQKYKDHKLAGEYRGHRDCHIGPDFLLIYRLTEKTLSLVRLGTHSELFR